MPKKGARGRPADARWSRLRRSVPPIRGDVVVSRGWYDHPLRSLDAETRYGVIAWKHGSETGDQPRASGIVHDPAVPTAVVVLDTLLQQSPTNVVMTSLDDVMVSLSRIGVPVANEGPRVTVSESDQEIARALERTLFPLASQPMEVDMARALRIGERQTQRRLAAYFKRYYVTVSGWRSTCEACASSSACSSRRTRARRRRR